MLAEDDGIVVADGLHQQSLGIIGVGRADDLQSGNVGEDRGEHLRMLGGRAEPGPDHGADDHRRLGLAAEHVFEFGGLIENLVEADAHEVDEHQFGDRTHAAGGGADRGAHIGRFRQRRIHQSLTVLGVETLGNTEHAAPGICLAVAASASDNVFPHQNDSRVSAHFEINRLVDGILHADLACHGLLPRSVRSIIVVSRRRRRRSGDPSRWAAAPLSPTAPRRR